MKAKKVFLSVIILSIFALCFLPSCTPKEKLKIVYLGDSIAEGVAGPSPVSERNNYAYFSLVGRQNDYTYLCRAVSGHQTHNLLEYIKREDGDRATMTRSHLMTADMISISILGNDLLYNDLGAIVLSEAREEYDHLSGILETAAKNFAEIVSTLRGYNKDAVLLFQTLYNPMYPESTMMNAENRVLAAEMGYMEEDYRAFGDVILAKLNNIIWDYDKAHPGEIVVVDVCKAFREIHEADPARGERLISRDWVHPSNEGHAVIAATIQSKLEELGLAKARLAVKEYKAIKIEQIERMYADTVDVKAVKKKINKCKTHAEVTKVYFDAISGIMPKYF